MSAGVAATDGGPRPHHRRRRQPHPDLPLETKRKEVTPLLWATLTVRALVVGGEEGEGGRGRGGGVAKEGEGRQGRVRDGKGCVRGGCKEFGFSQRLEKRVVDHWLEIFYIA